MVCHEPAEPSARRDQEIHRRAHGFVSRYARNHDIAPGAWRWLVLSVLVVEQKSPEASYTLGRPSIVGNPEIGGHRNVFAVLRRHSVNSFNCDAPFVETPVLS